jgi:hypothetical protein
MATNVAFYLLKDIPEPASGSETPVHALDSEKLCPVCHRAAMMPGHARDRRTILFVFHATNRPFPRGY